MSNESKKDKGTGTTITGNGENAGTHQTAVDPLTKKVVSVPDDYQAMLELVKQLSEEAKKNKEA